MAHSVLMPARPSKNPPWLVFPDMPYPAFEDLARTFRKLGLFDDFRFVLTGSSLAGGRASRIVVLPEISIRKDISEENVVALQKWRKYLPTKLTPQHPWTSGITIL